jgi:hypothetical protein
MRKIFLSIIMIVFCYSVFAQYDYYTTIKTPTNVSVEAIYFVEASADQIAMWEEQAANWISSHSSNAVRVAPASRTYNCHNFAWHNSDGGNKRWINQIDRYNQTNLAKYWSGTSPTYQLTINSSATKAFYSSGDHSAKVISATLFESKWGRWPRYQHTPTDCPYSSSNLQYYYIPVSGAGLICSSRTYSTLYISGASYNWVGSKVSFSGSGSSITATKTSDGSGWIQTQIYSSYSGTTVASEKQILWLGKPGQPTIVPSGYPTVEMQVGERKIFRSTSTPGYPTSYRWFVNGHFCGVEITSGSTSKYCTMLANTPSWNNYYFQTTNACGTSANAGGTIKVIDGDGGALFSVLKIYPNPAKDEITISISDSVYSALNTNEYEIEIIDNYNGLKIKEKGIAKEKGN